MKFLRGLANSRESNSLASRLRRRRFLLFESLIATVSRPIRILDLGGTENFWQQMGFLDHQEVSILLINIDDMGRIKASNVETLVGDARDLSQFEDDEFDIVFSNSVIEHVGGLDDQKRMADEIRRVGKRYFVQTPNRYFPIEPHFLFPFFQFLPRGLQVFLVSNFEIGWAGKAPSREDAERRVSSCQLLSQREIRWLFPGGKLYKERFLGLTKSFIVYDRWESTEGTSFGSIEMPSQP